MKPIHRRQFIGKTTLGIGAAFVLSQLPKELLAAVSFNNMPIGFQSYAIRDILTKDFPGTLKMMEGLGYNYVEMCSPKGYENAGFGPLVSMKPSDMRSIITDAGLGCPSCHFGFGELTSEKLDERIEFAQQLGLSHMICSTFGLPKTAMISDYNEAADKLNIAAAKIKKAGLQAGFHNHSIEFEKLEGRLIYDAIMSRLDAGLVKMQFQTEVINLGYKAADYFRKYPGRFISSHLSDWTIDKKQVPIGKGIIDWKGFFADSKIGGVKTFFVEMQMDTLKDSAAYIHGLP